MQPTLFFRCCDRRKFACSSPNSWHVRHRLEDSSRDSAVNRIFCPDRPILHGLSPGHGTTHSPATADHANQSASSSVDPSQSSYPCPRGRIYKSPCQHTGKHRPYRFSWRGSQRSPMQGVLLFFSGAFLSSRFCVGWPWAGSFWSGLFLAGAAVETQNTQAISGTTSEIRCIVGCAMAPSQFSQRLKREAA